MNLQSAKKEESVEENTLIAVDLAKNVFQVAVSDKPKKISAERRLRRQSFVRWFANRPAATVILEACGSAHHWARELRKLGHTPVLLPAHHVKPYVRGNKTDRADAEALLEAWRHADIHPVPVKTLDQQALAAFHRLRSLWIRSRTARLNHLRALVREFGVAIPVGPRQVVPRVRATLAAQPCPVPEPLHSLLLSAVDEVQQLEERIREIERQLETHTRQSEPVQWLRSVPGIGPLTSTALVAFLGTPHRFPSGRHLSSYLGLTPREHSSGQRRRLSSITRRGDGYLRTLLVHGARAVIASARRRGADPDRLRLWALRMVEARGQNKATVAVANKLARIAWAVWKNGRTYEPQSVDPST